MSPTFKEMKNKIIFKETNNYKKLSSSFEKNIMGMFNNRSDTVKEKFSELENRSEEVQNADQR